MDWQRMSRLPLRHRLRCDQAAVSSVSERVEAVGRVAGLAPIEVRCEGAHLVFEFRERADVVAFFCSYWAAIGSARIASPVRRASRSTLL
jgi:hypothetical protein